MTLNDTLLYHRAVYHSTLISEASSCSQWELAQRPTTGQRVRDFRKLSIKLDIFIKPLPSTLRGLCRRDSNKNLRVRDGAQLFQGKSFPGTTGLMLLSIHRDFALC